MCNKQSEYIKIRSYRKEVHTYGNVFKVDVHKQRAEEMRITWRATNRDDNT